MCGRFTRHYTWSEVHAFLSLLGAPQNLRPHYNIAPTVNVDVVRLDQDGRRELVSMRWGLVLFFWKAHSTTKCNKLIPGVEENLAWGFVSENLSGAGIELILDLLDLGIG